MKVATIILAALLLLGAFVNRRQKEQPTPFSDTCKVVMLDENGCIEGTVRLPRFLSEEYREVEFFDGTAPPPGVDFDILSFPMEEGGEVYLLCVK